MRAITAFTHEVDDAQLAASELLAQLNLQEEPLPAQHTLGILSCYTEYLDTGVMEAIAAQLPFDVVGLTTIANAVPGASGETMLGLLVLTGEELTYAVAVSDPIPEENEDSLRACYEAGLAKLGGPPSLLLSFMPLLTSMGGDFYVERMSEISGNVPNFGSLAVDHNSDYHESRVVCNAQSWRDRCVMVLLKGVTPKFYIGNISDERVFSEKGVVTASRGNLLQGINGSTVMDYLQSLGLKKNEEGTITGINSFPIIVNYNDGTEPVARAMFAIAPDGSAVCGGNIPVGSTISMGAFDPKEIVETTQRTLETALSGAAPSVLLMYSCVGRYFAQGYDQQAETNVVQARMQQAGIPYLMAYSGGELCPVSGTDGACINRNHNNTFVICAL